MACRTAGDDSGVTTSTAGAPSYSNAGRCVDAALQARPCLRSDAPEDRIRSASPESPLSDSGCDESWHSRTAPTEGGRPLRWWSSKWSHVCDRAVRCQRQQIYVTARSEIAFPSERCAALRQWTATGLNCQTRRVGERRSTCQDDTRQAQSVTACQSRMFLVASYCVIVSSGSVSLGAGLSRDTRRAERAHTETTALFTASRNGAAAAPARKRRVTVAW